jgi:hypothetical protein
MNMSRSSSVQTAGELSPFPVSAALPPKLALRPVEPKHYAKLPRNEGVYNKTEVPLSPMGFSASRLHQLVKRLWQAPRQNAVESKISATSKLSLLLSRPVVVSQNATISKETLSHRLSERAANDNTQDVASPPQILSTFRTIESLLKSATDALREAKDLANSTRHAGGHAKSIGEQVRLLDDDPAGDPRRHCAAAGRGAPMTDFDRLTTEQQIAVRMAIDLARTSLGQHTVRIADGTDAYASRDPVWGIRWAMNGTHNGQCLARGIEK